MKKNSFFEKKVDKSKEEILEEIKKISPKEYYRFVVDGYLQEREKTWLSYSDREKGSVAALLNAFSYALQSESGLSINLLKTIHKLAINLPDTTKLCSEEFRDGSVYIGIVVEGGLQATPNITKKGFFEFMQHS